MIALRKVLVATDFEAASDAALAYGRALARRFGASLHLLLRPRWEIAPPALRN